MVSSIEHRARKMNLIGIKAVIRILYHECSL